MKWVLFLTILIIFSYSQQEPQMTAEEIDIIKEDIIALSEKHAQGLENMDHKEVMKFYADVEDFIIFGDGYYWGDYLTMDGMWKGFLEPSGEKKVIKWDLSNHKIHVHSQDAASYLVEFDHARTGSKGDTTFVTGCFSYGMQKIEGQWKAVTVHVTHNYKPGYGYERAQPGFYAKERGLDWWSYYSPEEREKRLKKEME